MSPGREPKWWEEIDTDGWYYIIGMRDAKKPIRKGIYAYYYSIVDEDWNPLPSDMRVHPNDNVAINQARAGKEISEDNPVICKLRRTRYGVEIDSVVTDENKQIELREMAIRRRSIRS